MVKINIKCDKLNQRIIQHETSRKLNYERPS